RNQEADEMFCESHERVTVTCPPCPLFRRLGSCMLHLRTHPAFRAIWLRRLGQRRSRSPAGHRGHFMEGAIMAHAASLPVLTAEGGLSRYLEEIRRFPMLEPQEEYMLAKSWREHGDRTAAHKLVTSHLRLLAQITIGHPRH